jgi:hypothetical protein
MEALWQQGINTFVDVFSYDFAETIRLFQDYLYIRRQLDSVKDLHSNYPQIISVTNQQLDIRSFTDLLKRIEEFPATECESERLFCPLCNLTGDFRHQMSDSIIVDLLMIQTRIIWPDAGHIKECAEILREVQLDTEPDQTAG